MFRLISLSYRASFLCGLSRETFEYSKLVTLQDHYAQADSQLCKRKHEWKRNLSSVYLQPMGLRVILIFLKFFFFPVNFSNRRILSENHLKSYIKCHIHQRVVRVEKELKGHLGASLG